MPVLCKMVIGWPQRFTLWLFRKWFSLFMNHTGTRILTGAPEIWYRFVLCDWLAKLYDMLWDYRKCLDSEAQWKNSDKWDTTGIKLPPIPVCLNTCCTYAWSMYPLKSNIFLKTAGVTWISVCFITTYLFIY